MRRWLWRFGAFAAVPVIALVLWPAEPVDTAIEADPSDIAAVGAGGLDAWLAAEEARFDDITPGVEKRIVWATAPGAATDEVVVYIHGFSATSEELRPVPDRVAQALGANLLFWRLAGHGRGGDAMAEPRAGDWIEDMAEALAVADLLGDRVTVIATSTGGTLAAIAATLPETRGAFDRLVMVSPNFRIAAPVARVLTWPAVRHWGPLVVGAERRFESLNAAHGRYWTTRYPTVATVPMGALVAHARALDYSVVAIPALFVFSDADRVVSAAATREVAARWGGDVTLAPQVPGPGDDPFAHVLAGDILSPSLTPGVSALILDWIAAH
ncbi:alpha/beta hydrolase [Palleronia sp. KMU-117]|uniref:alpha/beta hydrolase n=1 Tax=Palleronia sp. KMU-117 TaxID=3434108 RepID=UPI003D729FAB